MEGYYDALHGEYEEIVTPLREQKAELKAKLESIKPGADEVKKYQTDLAVLTRRIEDAVFDGKADLEKRLQAKVKSLQDNFEARQRSADELMEQIAALEKEIKKVASDVVNRNYPLLQEITRSKMMDAVESIDEAWSALQRFERETPVLLSMGIHFDGLKIRPILGTTQVRRRLERWL